jgi:hypothetical protein
MLHNVSCLGQGSNSTISAPVLQAFSTNALSQDNKSEEVAIEIDHQNPLVLSFLNEKIKSFQDLRHADDPILRSHYQQTMTIANVKRAATIWEQHARELQQGREWKLTWNYPNDATRKFSIGHVEFALPARVIKPGGDTVLVTISIEEKHPHKFHYAALRAAGDPAIRLDVHVSGKDVDRKAFAGWIRSNGKIVVKKVDTLVDQLEGNPLQYSMMQPRRWVRLTKPDGKTHVYLS